MVLLPQNKQTLIVIEFTSLLVDSICCHRQFVQSFFVMILIFFAIVRNVVIEMLTANTIVVLALTCAIH